MLSALKQHWHELTKGRPGRRFQQRYEHKHETRDDRPLIRRSVQPVVGVILFAAGIVFCVIPGPGLPLVFLGAAVLAERSLFIARALDWSEVKLRNLLARGKKWWRKASPLGKNALIIIAATAVAGVGYGAYQVVFGR